MYDLDNDFSTDFSDFDVNELEVFVDEEGDLSHLTTDAELIELEIKISTEQVAELERALFVAYREEDATEISTLGPVLDVARAELEALRAELNEALWWEATLSGPAAPEAA